MTTILVLRFPRGRRDATQRGWLGDGAAVELPPSPWRLLRGLHATWRTRAPELDEPTVHSLLAVLAAPPRYFMPRHEVGPAPAGAAELAACWSQALQARQHEALTRLAAALTYLGQTDNMCEGFLDQDWEPNEHDRWEPLDVAETVPSSAQLTTVLAPSLPLDVRTLLACPSEVHRRGLVFPLGSRLVGYVRHPAASVRSPGAPITTVRFRVASGRPLPQTEAVFLTDLLRRAALSRLGGLREERQCTSLGGRTADEHSATDQHAHTHYLPLIESERLVGLAAWTPAGLPADEATALMSLRRLSTAKGTESRWSLRLVVAGTAADGAPELGGPAKTWTSATPYTPSRFAQRGVDRVEHLRADVTRELDYRGLPAPTRVEVMDRGWEEWRRYRPSASRKSPQGRASKPSAFLRLHFAEPVAGPLALGHLSHFGLGLFTPEV